MQRQMLYILDEDAPSSFAKDADLPALPLPALDDTLDRYYESLKPFGTEEQLKNSRRIIDTFRNGAGKQLHAVLEERAKTTKNWVETWWQDYAYGVDRTPTLPFRAMAAPLMMDHAGLVESEENYLKILALSTFHCIEYWNLIRLERMRPNTNPSGSLTFSSFLLKRLYSTIREPGEIIDKITCHFRTKSEGKTPTHALVIGRGRMFRINCMHDDGETIMSAQELLLVFQQILAQVDSAGVVEYPVPVLTCDNRSSWAKNRVYLRELSPHNADVLDIIEKAAFTVSLDDHRPVDYSECCQKLLAGDLHSRWADKSASYVGFRNGRGGCWGDHACYDGTISMAMMFFVLLSFAEIPEPDWSELPIQAPVPKEISFDLDEHLREEVQRVRTQVYAEKDSVISASFPFTGYGKAFLKEERLHPDSFIQMIIQLTYFKMHKEFVATYETALMRNYYNGRTETLRSCTLDSIAWVESFLNPNESDVHKVQLLRKAVASHNNLMDMARNGKGVDRHLFGMWCAAYEADLEIPELYDDELYKKSGGGGNFLLSTSTLGYSIVCGYVAPMLQDGYAVFYSITNNVIFVVATAFRESEKTSAHKFVSTFGESMTEVREMVERVKSAKL